MCTFGINGSRLTIPELREKSEPEKKEKYKRVQKVKVVKSLVF